MLNAEAMSKLRELLLLTVARQGSVQDWQVQNMQTSIERWFTQKLAELVIPELALNLVRRASSLSFLRLNSHFPHHPACLASSPPTPLRPPARLLRARRCR